MIEKSRILQLLNCKICFNFSFSKLKGLPKPLLPICDKPLISHWIDIAEKVDAIDEIVVVTNSHFFPKFLEWKSHLQTGKKGSSSIGLGFLNQTFRLRHWDVTLYMSVLLYVE